MCLQGVQGRVECGGGGFEKCAGGRPGRRHLAGIDERINAPWPAYEAALTAAGVKFAVHHYPGTQHGFNNDTTPRYDPAAARLAWGRTVEFLKSRLA